jgi:hypothetical protein
MDEAHQQPDSGRFADAVGSEEAKLVALLNRQIEIEKAAPAAVVTGEGVGFDGRDGVQSHRCIKQKRTTYTPDGQFELTPQSLRQRRG